MVATSVLSFEEVLRSLPPNDLRGKLVVDVLNVKGYAKQVQTTNNKIGKMKIKF